MTVIVQSPEEGKVMYVVIICSIYEVGEQSFVVGSNLKVYSVNLKATYPQKEKGKKKTSLENKLSEIK